MKDMKFSSNDPIENIDFKLRRMDRMKDINNDNIRT